jgi:hypothetical protein
MYRGFILFLRRGYRKDRAGFKIIDLGHFVQDQPIATGQKVSASEEPG